MKKYFYAGSVFALGALFSLTAAFSSLPGSPASPALATPGVDEPPVSCLDVAGSGYNNWPSSSTWKDNEWDTSFIVSSSGSNPVPLSTFVDLNGDGLGDYIYVESPQWETRRINCTHLNNGTGWDLVYKCFANKSGGVWTFYGDCADV